jgi:hypothetical protein
MNFILAPSAIKDLDRISEYFLEKTLRPEKSYSANLILSQAPISQQSIAPMLSHGRLRVDVMG